MSLSNRQIVVLAHTIETYVSTAEPVSSGTIFQSGVVDASSATIRNDMAALEEEGYLHQPHTSSGRIPTEKGYRLYVQQLVEARPDRASEHADVLGRVAAEAYTPHGKGKNIARTLAHLATQVIVIGFGHGEAYACGLKYLVVQPEFHDPACLNDFSVAMDRLDETLEALNEAIGDVPTVVLGSENPFGPQCGTVVGRFQLPPGNMVTLGIVGPMRMAYDRHLGILHELYDVFSI
jgi:transcriptional regulator of heat shock response